MRRFTIPKAWLDGIVIAGKTCSSSEAGAKGVFIASSRGGLYAPGTPQQSNDFQEIYLRAILGFIGIKDPPSQRTPAHSLRDRLVLKAALHRAIHGLAFAPTPGGLKIACSPSEWGEALIANSDLAQSAGSQCEAASGERPVMHHKQDEACGNCCREDEGVDGCRYALVDVHHRDGRQQKHIEENDDDPLNRRDDPLAEQDTISTPFEGSLECRQDTCLHDLLGPRRRIDRHRGVECLGEPAWGLPEVCMPCRHRGPVFGIDKVEIHANGCPQLVCMSAGNPSANEIAS